MEPLSPGRSRGGRDFTTTANGQPALSGALATLDCVVAGRHPAGDHTIIVGHTEQITLGDHEPPAVYYSRSFHTLVPEEKAG